MLVEAREIEWEKVQIVVWKETKWESWESGDEEWKGENYSMKGGGGRSARLEWNLNRQL